MAQPGASFTSLAGAPVHYDRPPVAPYGTRGVAKRFYSEADFTAALERCFSELWDVCPFGRAAVITSAGAYVKKPGQHGAGRAFDLDGVFWPGKDFVTLNAGFNAGDRNFYYGVECILRRHFGQVLNFDYNADHRDHFHIDDSQPVALRKNSTAVTLFVQGMLRRVYGRSIGVDGTWGNATEDALREACVAAGMVGTVTSVSEWQQFLLLSARRSFGSTIAAAAADPAYDGKSAAALLDEVYRIIRRELGTTALRKPIESALDAFGGHPDTQAWLNNPPR
jgi:hypothetical protein